MISNLAYVNPQAKIGENVTIEPFAFIDADVEIGAGTWIGSGAVIRNGARIGCDCKIHPTAVIAGEPQDLKFKGEYSTAVIGDRTVIRECVTISRGTAAKGTTIVGSDCLIMACAHVAHDCVVGNHVILVNGVLLAGEVEVGDWAILGGQTAVHQFSKIGAHAMTGGGSLINKDIPAFVKAGHLPISFVGINFIGLRRRGFSSEKIAEIQDIYRIIFQSGMIYSKACDVVEQTIPQSPERDEILNFIRTSKRGILKPYNSRRNSEDLD
ncbi:MAG: acyl-ACP--UDP-N-acetylglucosamine O-acyltransferase [Rikenellaceae bacterium]|jgi:UDP-N-acetylglucosamine acyltransferase|nr:acyl-ACP--UDP-N-acetylglucosamine O-acyltransferase [Rikenellaceae bacterium]MBR6495721.1 acyl-ACP--UDP-N-acetylglucosamine O-acyltransferase [Rikenellaceae bacterium]